MVVIDRRIKVPPGGLSFLFTPSVLSKRNKHNDQTAKESPPPSPPSPKRKKITEEEWIETRNSITRPFCWEVHRDEYKKHYDYGMKIVKQECFFCDHVLKAPGYWCRIVELKECKYLLGKFKIAKLGQSTITCCKECRDSRWHKNLCEWCSSQKHLRGMDVCHMRDERCPCKEDKQQ